MLFVLYIQADTDTRHTHARTHARTHADFVGAGEEQPDWTKNVQARSGPTLVEREIGAPHDRQTTPTASVAGRLTSVVHLDLELLRNSEIGEPSEHLNINMYKQRVLFEP